MPLLALTAPSVRRRLLGLVTTIAVGTLATLGSPTTARAQASLSHAEDAAPVPRGALRFTMANAWTRYEGRFSDSGVRALGDELSTDSLGPRQLPGLAPAEGALQVLANDPRVRLSFGRLNVMSDARIVTTPIAVEYGVTRRLSVGFMVPIVQTRRASIVRVNADPRAASDTVKRGTVGFVPAASRQNAATTNAALVTALTTASQSLAALVTRCQANPAAAECDPIRGHESDAQLAAARAAEFAGAITTAYGSTPQTAIVAPVRGGALATAIERERAALATRLATYIPGTTLGNLFNAPTEFSYADLQGRNGTAGLLQSALGGGLDSIRTLRRIGFGDIEVRAQFLVLDRVQRDTLPMRGPQLRLAVGGSYRFATSRVDSARNLVDIPTGEGGGAEIRSALDIVTGRLGATVAARYAKSYARTVEAPVIGFPEGGFPYPLFGQVSRTAGDLFAMDVTPRVYVSEWLSLEGQYGVERRGAPTYVDQSAEPCSDCAVLPGSILPAAANVQRVGAGLRYSTVDSYLRGRARYPVEVSYRHLQTITGNTNAPRLTRDQIQLRIYYRMRR